MVLTNEKEQLSEKIDVLNNELKVKQESNKYLANEYRKLERRKRRLGQ